MAGTKTGAAAAARATDKTAHDVTADTIEEVRTVERFSKRLSRGDKQALAQILKGGAASGDASAAETSKTVTAPSRKPGGKEAAKGIKPSKSKPPKTPGAGGEGSSTLPAKSAKSSKSTSATATVVLTEEEIRANKIKQARQHAAERANRLAEEGLEYASFGSLTISQMEYIGLECKTGFLMKQSSILGM